MIVAREQPTPPRHHPGGIPWPHYLIVLGMLTGIGSRLEGQSTEYEARYATLRQIFQDSTLSDDSMLAAINAVNQIATSLSPRTQDLLTVRAGIDEALNETLKAHLRDVVAHEYENDSGVRARQLLHVMRQARSRVFPAYGVGDLAATSDDYLKALGFVAPYHNWLCNHLQAHALSPFDRDTVANLEPTSFDDARARYHAVCDVPHFSWY